MKTSLFIILSMFLFIGNYSAQNVAINQKDAKGKQHGKWKLWLDESMRILNDSSKASYCRYTYFDHGINLYPMGGIDKKWKMDPASGSLQQKGKIKLLDGENKWYDKKGVLKSYQKFSKGEPKIIKFFWEENSFEIWDYTKKWELQPWSWFASIGNKNGEVNYFYHMNTNGKWQMTAEKDSSRRFEITEIKTFGDSTVSEVKVWSGGKLNAQYLKIFIKQKNPTEWLPPVLHGRCVEYRGDGKKENEGDYYFGKRKGEWKFWDENGVERTVNY